MKREEERNNGKTVLLVSRGTWRIWWDLLQEHIHSTPVSSSAVLTASPDPLLSYCLLSCSSDLSSPYSASCLAAPLLISPYLTFSPHFTFLFSSHAFVSHVSAFSFSFYPLSIIFIKTKHEPLVTDHTIAIWSPSVTMAACKYVIIS